jgi:sugar phosphate isomerase/epimerase
VQAYRNRSGNDTAHDGPVSLQQMRDAIAASGLPCDSLHGLYGNDLDPSTLDEMARRHAVEVFKQEGDLALSLGGPLVVVHCAGILVNPAGRDERQQRLDQLRRSIEELGAYGQANNIRYAFENLPPYHAIGDRVDELVDLLAGADSSSVGMCFDVAHANLAGDPIAAAGRAGESMIYCHACDNHGRKDDHLMPFLGQIDWMAFAETLRQARYDGVIMLEIFHSLDELKQLIDEGIVEKLNAFLLAAGGRP